MMEPRSMTPPEPIPEMVAEEMPATSEEAADVEPTREYHTVDVYYATDRMRTGSVEPISYFNGQRNEVAIGQSPLQYGKAEVTIPKTHTPGQVESPKWYKLEFWPDPRKHVTVATLTPMDSANFHDAVGTAAADAPQNQALIFVHGFNVSFDNAIRRTGQIAYDLDFPGVAMAFSWPSNGIPALSAYTSDQNDADWAQLHLAQLLLELQVKSEIEKVHIVAHSMGSRVLAGALDLAAREGFHLELNNVILAAPDLDAETFTTQILPRIKDSSGRFTMYASSRDQALMVSRRVNGNHRLGLSGEDLTVVKGMETVDVSEVDTSLIGHGYYGSHKKVMDDLLAIFVSDRSAAQRGLHAGSRGEWLLP